MSELRKRNAELLAACKRWMLAIEKWLETGEPENADESKSIYEQAADAVAKAEGGDDDSN